MRTYFVVTSKYKGIGVWFEKKKPQLEKSSESDGFSAIMKTSEKRVVLDWLGVANCIISGLRELTTFIYSRNSGVLVGVKGDRNARVV